MIAIFSNHDYNIFKSRLQYLQIMVTIFTNHDYNIYNWTIFKSPMELTPRCHPCSLPDEGIRITVSWPSCRFGSTASWSPCLGSTRWSSWRSTALVAAAAATYEATAAKSTLRPAPIHVRGRLLVESSSRLKRRIWGRPSSLGEDGDVGGGGSDGWKP
jgi:hypothetical protein